MADDEGQRERPVKAPPHMRRLNLRVCSPSDNLSPCSQKLMAADVIKGVKPRSFKSRLAKQPSHLQDSSTSEAEMPPTTGAATEEGPETDVPPSPTKNVGGLTTL